MPKWMILLVFAIFGGGTLLLLFGLQRYDRHNDYWVNNLDQIAAELCTEEETLRIMQAQTSRRTYRDFYCDDADGNTRDLSDALTDEHRRRWLPAIAPLFMGVGTLIAGTLLLAGWSWWQKKSYQSRRAAKKLKG